MMRKKIKMVEVLNEQSIHLLQIDINAFILRKESLPSPYESDFELIDLKIMSSTTEIFAIITYADTWEFET